VCAVRWRAGGLTEKKKVFLEHREKKMDRSLSHWRDKTTGSANERALGGMLTLDLGQQ